MDAVKEAIAAGQTVEAFQPGPFGDNPTRDGEAAIEGPHYPKPHTWYARVLLKGGVVVKVLQ